MSNFKRKKPNPKHDTYSGWHYDGVRRRDWRHTPLAVIKPVDKAVEEALKEVDDVSGAR